MRRVALILLVGLLVRLYYGPLTPGRSEYAALLELLPHPANPGTLSTGTGFYIGRTGELITANHVVRDCRRIEVASQSVKPIDARLLHASAELDLALLRTDRPPEAMLAIAGANPRDARFFLVGYPSGGGMLAPTTAALQLVNAEVKGRHVDAQTLLYLEGSVKHGNSGGPIIDTDGNAVGVMLRVADRETAREQLGIDAAEVGMGEGLRVLRAFLQEARYFPRPGDRAASSTETAKDAIVRVFCWE